MKFGHFLKQQREQLEWKQPEAADAIGIEQSYLSKLENNKAIPSAEIFDKLMETYQFNINQIGQSVSDSELDKLKEIVLVRDFIITHKKRNESSRHRWLLISLACSMLGTALLLYGLMLKEDRITVYTYESKGLILEGEPNFVFSELPNYRTFRQYMGSTHSRKDLQQLKLFPRLDYKQINSAEYSGYFFDIKTDEGLRRYILVGDRAFTEKKSFYIGVSLGAALLIGAFGAFYFSRRW